MVKQDELKRWLHNQHSHHSDIEPLLPTAGQLKNFTPGGKRVLANAMKKWQNKRSPAEREEALSTFMRIMQSNSYGKNHKQAFKKEWRSPVQRLIAGNINKALTNMSLKRVDDTNKLERELLDQGITDPNKRAMIVRNSLVGSAYRNKNGTVSKKEIGIRRYHEFMNLSQKSLHGFSKEAFKQIVGDYEIYENTAGYVLIEGAGNYIGSMRTVDEAMQVIYEALDEKGYTYTQFKKDFGKNGVIGVRRGRR